MAVIEVVRGRRRAGSVVGAAVVFVQDGRGGPS